MGYFKGVTTKGRKTPTEFICEECGSSFPNPHWYHGANFCSLKCRMKNRTGKHYPKLSEALKGKKKSPEHIKNIVLSHKGKPKLDRRGDKHWNWKGGISVPNKQFRKTIEYKLWRTAVFERDNYTCIWCGDNSGGNLEADHIKPFCDYPELRLAIDNGRTLCEDCYKTTDTYGWNYYHKYKKQ